MLCDICKKNEATVHLTQIVDAKMLKVDLCETCSKAKGIQEASGFSLADLLVGLGAADEIKTEAPGVQCSMCGFTQADFKKAGRLGCPECYKTFSDALDGLLKTMHKGTRHVGKVPESLRQSRDLSDRMKLLEKKLSKAIDDEDFEEAAILRDEIKQTKARVTNAAAT